MLFRSKNINYKFHYLLIYIVILLYNSESKNIKLSLINNESYIQITFANIGKNYFLSRDYNGPKPSSILSNKPSFCNISAFYCDIDTQYKNNTIILKFDDGIINSCNNMFKDLVNITKIDLSYFDTSLVRCMAYMFENCTDLIKINFGNMDTSKVGNMEYFLHGCKNLESVDVSNFDTSHVTNMRYMFSSLYSLKSLKLSNHFKTSQVKDMSGMFYDIRVLTSMNLSMFDTSKVENISYMFSGARKLKYLNISNFNIRNIISFYNMFADCDELQYLGIGHIELDIFENIYKYFPINSDHLKICIKDEKIIDYFSFYRFQSIYAKIICSDTCVNENNIYIDKVQNKCVQSCDKKLYIYGIGCYEKCPVFTTIKTNSSHECIPYICFEKNKEISIENTPEGYYFDSSDKDYKKCFEICKYCYGPGDNKYNNCSECKSGFKFLDDSESITNNCYEICPSYYYFNKSNNNEYICTEKCPDKYNKIILSKRICIDNCKNYNNNSLVEFNGICMNNCSKGTYIS